MYVIGLTGNIATGKSTVAAMLGFLGAEVIDADALAHAVMAAGTPVHASIVARFGAQILAPTGEIDRARLGAIVFRDPAALADLERLVHPAVLEETWRRLGASSAAVGVVEAIKLLEAQMHTRCDAIWVVTSSEAQQLGRLMTTRGLSAEQARLRIEAQTPAAWKVARADVVIDNSGALAATWEQVRAAWNAIPGAPPAAADLVWPGAPDRAVTR